MNITVVFDYEKTIEEGWFILDFKILNICFRWDKYV